MVCFCFFKPASVPDGAHNCFSSAALDDDYRKRLRTPWDLGSQFEHFWEARLEDRLGVVLSNKAVLYRVRARLTT